MRKVCFFTVFCVAVAFLTVPLGAGDGIFLTDTPFEPAGEIDRLLVASLSEQGLKPANRCSDGVFLRRVHIDLIGTLPTAQEARAFLASKEPGKRATLVDELMQREEFVDYWTLKWCDILRVKAEFPINLWPNGVQAYAQWIRESVANNRPYDEFARALLTANGSNFRVPPVNFYRAVQGDRPETLAGAVALTFMGTRLESWSEQDRAALTQFFSRVAFKGTAEWKETIVFPDPAQIDPLDVVYPDGTKATLSGDTDPRIAFADWLLKPDNPWFARNIGNRAWSWFFGYGLIHEPDDIRPDNPPVHPALLDHLAQSLVESDYDLRALFRRIVTSGAYQQCSIPSERHAEAERLFAQYPVRRLDAEVLLDALGDISGQREEYSSAIPEPFTFVPRDQRNIALTDGSITSPFLKMFGRPSRDTGLESERSRTPSKEQRLHLLNSTQVRVKIDQSWKVFGALRRNRGNIDAALDVLYLTVLSRYPTPAEREIARTHLAENAGKRAATDLLWALLNSKEFIYRH